MRTSCATGPTAAFLVREDNNQLLTARRLSAVGRQGNLFRMVMIASGELVSYRPDQGYARDGVLPATQGQPCGHPIGRPRGWMPAVIRQLQSLRHSSHRKRVGGLTSVAAHEVREAARMFATEKPSCYYSWVGHRTHRRRHRNNRALCTFYCADGAIRSRGSNFLYASTPIQPITAQELLPKRTARRLGMTEFL